MSEKRNHDYKGSKFLSPEDLEERLKNSDLSEEEKKLSREVIKQAKQHNIGLAEPEIDVGKRNFLKAMGVLAGALLVLGKMPKVLGDEMIEKFNLNLGSKQMQQRPSELYYWSQIWKSNYVNEFGVQIGLEFKKEGITKDSSEELITQAVRNAASTMENLLNAFTCWGQNAPAQTTRGVCGEGGFCQTFAQLHAPAGQFFCSRDTRMVAWDIRVLNAKFLPNGDLKLRMNVLIVDKKYFHTSERVDAPWLLEKFAPPEYIKDLHLSKVLEGGKPYPNPKYYTFQSGPNKGKEFKDGEPFEAADFLGMRVPPYKKLDEASWVKDLTLKVLRGGGTDSGNLELDPWSSYPFEQLGDTTGLKLLNKVIKMQNEGWRKYKPTKGDYDVFINEYRETYAALWKHIRSLGNAYYKYIEPEFYHLVWYTYGARNYGGEVIIPKNLLSSGGGCKPGDSPIPGANCETGCLLPGALVAAYPCQSYTPPSGTTCPVSGFNVTANVDCITPITVTLSILNCWNNNKPVKNTTFYYKYGYGANWNVGSFNTGNTGTGEIEILREYTNKGEFWLYLYTDSALNDEIFSTFSSSCACTEPCCSNEDCPSGQICVNGQCVTPSNVGNPTLSNFSATTANFCKSGFTVSGRLTQDGAGTRGIVNVAVNNNKVACQLVDSGNYDFSITVPLSSYKKYLVKGSNTITVQGILCASGDCSGSCLGPLTAPQSVTIPACSCDYSLDASKYSVTPTTVNVGESVVVSGAIVITAANFSLCPSNGIDIDIYDNGTKVATAITDAKGNFSTSVTLNSAGTHTIEAKLGNSTVSKNVTVNKAPIKLTVGVTYWQKQGLGFATNTNSEIGITGGEFAIYVYPQGEDGILTLAPRLSHIDIPISTIAVVTYKGAIEILSNKPNYYSPPPQWNAQVTGTECYLTDKFCSLDWALKDSIITNFKNALAAAKNPDGTRVFSNTPSNPQIDEIANQANSAAVQVLNRWFLDIVAPTFCENDAIVKTGCANTASSDIGTGIFGIGSSSRFWKLINFTV